MSPKDKGWLPREIHCVCRVGTLSFSHLDLLGGVVAVQLLNRVRLFCYPHAMQHARLPCPSPPPGLFQGVSSSHQVAKVLELQHQSFQ